MLGEHSKLRIKMEITKKESPRLFLPFELSIKIETEGEYIILGHLFDCWNTQKTCSFDKESVREMAIKLSDGIRR